MRHLLSILTLAALLFWSAGCASSLSGAVGISNALGAAAVAAGTQVNADFARADKACLWTPGGAPSPLPLDAQAACLARTRAAYAPVLKAYDDFLAIWPAWSALVHFAEAQEVLGRRVDLSRILAMLPDVLRLADAFTAAYSTLASPPLPAAGVR